MKLRLKKKEEERRRGRRISKSNQRLRALPPRCWDWGLVVLYQAPSASGCQLDGKGVMKNNGIDVRVKVKRDEYWGRIGRLVCHPGPWKYRWPWEVPEPAWVS